MSNIKRRVLSFLNKDDFDPKRPVTPEEFHTSFFFLAKLFALLDLEHKPWWMYVSPVAGITSALIGLVVISYSFYFYVMALKLDEMVENGTYWLVIFYKFVIVSGFFINRRDYYKLADALREDFAYVNTKGKKYREAYFENQKLTFKVTYLSGIFIGFIGGGMAFSGFIMLIYYKLVYEKGHQRPLPYPFLWYKKDVFQTPYYEIMFSICVTLTFFHTYIYIFMTECQITWVREIASKADIVVWSIRDLLSDVRPARNKQEEEHYALLIKSRMRDIISMHHSMIILLEYYAKVYKKFLLLEQKISVPIICMTAYSSAEKFDRGEMPVITILLCSAVVVVVFIPSFLCTFLSEKVQSVSYACWDMPFWNAGPIIRTYAVLMMQRAMRPLPIQSAGFEDISLQTYFAIITRAYSGFNMLRQVNLDF